MDDILVPYKDDSSVKITSDDFFSAVQDAKLIVSAGKIQQLPPWKYLGYKITEQKVTPKLIQIQDNPKTLSGIH